MPVLDSRQKSSAIYIEGLTVAYQGVPAIENIHLEVKPGEMFGLIGLNGAGKTTLIKTLLNLRAPDQGQALVYGQSSETKSVKDRLAFLPERFEPSWFLSGLEFLKFSAALYKKRLSDAECYEAAESLALDPQALKRRVQTYSKGMRQKLGILGTVLTGCDLLILDEPMSGLDPVARALVKETLLQVKARGCTVFLSSHILADMDEICDRVAVLHNRTIQFNESPKELKAVTSSTNLERAFLHFIEKKTAA